MNGGQAARLVQELVTPALRSSWSQGHAAAKFTRKGS